MVPTLYLKQAFEYRFAPKKAVNFMLTEIVGDCRYPKVIGDGKILKECNYSFKQFLFIYRLLLLKIIETLDCILLNNQDPFIEPHKNIHFFYQLATFMYNDIGLIRRKFLFKQTELETNFDEIPKLNGDIKNIISSWRGVRPKYLDYKGEIETLFATNGYQEFHIPIRTKMMIEAIDEILEFQRSQYSPIKISGIQLKDGILSYKDKKVKFTKNTTRLNLIKLIYDNQNGISSKTIREKLEMNYDLFKTNIKQLKDKIKDIKLTIKYDKDKKLYLLTTL
jgi:hypothetical protein